MDSSFWTVISIIFFMAVAEVQSLPPVTNRWTALGDSFAAGIGAGAEYDPAGSGSCSRRTGAHPVQLDSSPLWSMNPHTFNFIACSGAVIADVVSNNQNTQLNQLIGLQIADQNIATISIGGNDAQFSSVLDACIFQAWASEAECGPALAAAQAVIQGIDDQLVSTYSGILSAVANSNGQYGFRLVVTGYPTFFNDVALDCNNYSFGFWGFVPLTIARRSAINGLVTLMNQHIKAAVDRTNLIWGPDSVLFVDPNDAFLNHRFCEPGVVEPDHNNDNVWFFLLLGTDTGTPVTNPGSPVDITPGDCQSILNGTIPPFGDLWGRYLFCSLTEGLAEGKTLQPWLNNAGIGFVPIPEAYAKAFHPKTAGHTAIKQAIEAAIQLPTTSLYNALIMFQGSADDFTQFINTVPRVIGKTTRRIDSPAINFRGYQTWLTHDYVVNIRGHPSIAGVSFIEKEPEVPGNTPRSLPKVLNRNTTVDTTSHNLETRQETLTRLDMQWSVVGINDWHLTATSEPPHYVDATTQYLQFGGYVYQPSRAAGVNIYIVDGGANLQHEDLHFVVPRYYGALGFPMIDLGGHGTCMASNAAGILRGSGKGANIIPVRWTYDDTSDDGADLLFDALLWILVDAINHPLQPAIVNLSGDYLAEAWLHPDDDDLDDVYLQRTSDPWFYFLQLFFNQNIIVVTSAGNDGLEESPEAISAHGPRRYAAPGEVGSGRLIVVGAYNEQRAVLPQSNRFYSITTVWAPGHAIPCADHLTNNGYDLVLGTSSAAAITSGIVATFLQRPDLVSWFNLPIGLHGGMIALLQATSYYAWDHFPGTLPGLTTFDYIPCPAASATSKNRRQDSHLEERQEDFVSVTVRDANGVLHNNIAGGRCAGLVPIQELGGYIYQGCVSDTDPSNPVLQGVFSPQTNLADCSLYCALNAYPMFGMNGLGYCYCGNHANNPIFVVEKQCNVYCTNFNNLREKCGGLYIDQPTSNSQTRMSLYSIPPVAPIAGWTSSGCYNDTWDRTLDGLQFSADSSMTPSKCSGLCSGYRYFGLENSDECYCGNEIDNTRKTNPTACDMPCSGDSHSICGGGWLLSVYEGVSTNGVTPAVAGWQHSWCFTDSAQRTLTGPVQTSSQMTPSLCAKFCCGWDYFGIEYGTECYCGNSLDVTKTAPLGDCNTPCAGNTALQCGGGWRLSVYEDDPDNHLSACNSTSAASTSISSSTTSSQKTSSTSVTSSIKSSTVTSSTKSSAAASTTTSSTVTSTTKSSTAASTTTSSTVTSTTKSSTVSSSAVSTTTAGVVCPSTPPSCDAGSCAGTFKLTTGAATCNGALAGCQCVPTAVTCGSKAPCDSNNCAGVFNTNDGKAYCSNYFAGCECQATASTCGSHGSCDDNGCNGVFNLNDGNAYCSGKFAGCQCNPTVTTCGSHGSCDDNGCNGVFNLNDGNAYCSGKFAGCQCSPTATTCGSHGSCDDNGCNGAFNFNDGNAYCTGKFAGCQCNPTGNTCGDWASCDSNDCNGAFNLDNGNAYCTGHFAGCQCNPTANTCGAWGSCDGDNCNGAFNMGNGNAYCTGYFAGCRCVPTGNTCGSPQKCENNGCAGSVDDHASQSATCKGEFAGCSCIASAYTTGYCAELDSCSFGDCAGVLRSGSNFGLCSAGRYLGCGCYTPSSAPSGSQPPLPPNLPCYDIPGCAMNPGAPPAVVCKIAECEYLDNTNRGIDCSCVCSDGNIHEQFGYGYPGDTCYPSVTSDGSATLDVLCALFPFLNLFPGIC